MRSNNGAQTMTPSQKNAKFEKFMFNWWMLNAVRRAHGLPEMLYGDMQAIRA